jgi:hypothetical protein
MPDPPPLPCLPARLMFRRPQSHPHGQTLWPAPRRLSVTCSRVPPTPSPSPHRAMAVQGRNPAPRLIPGAARSADSATRLPVNSPSQLSCGGCRPPCTRVTAQAPGGAVNQPGRSAHSGLDVAPRTPARAGRPRVAADRTGRVAWLAWAWRSACTAACRGCRHDDGFVAWKRFLPSGVITLIHPLS